MEEIQEELDAVKQSEQRLRNEASFFCVLRVLHLVSPLQVVSDVVATIQYIMKNYN